MALVDEAGPDRGTKVAARFPESRMPQLGGPQPGASVHMAHPDHDPDRDATRSRDQRKVFPGTDTEVQILLLLS
eukprot:SAG22_NODE_8584_length_643_cov_1.246324_1_plen_73_part_10